MVSPSNFGTPSGSRKFILIASALLCLAFLIATESYQRSLAIFEKAFGPSDDYLG
jgi:hypothetical protein